MRALKKAIAYAAAMDESDADDVRCDLIAQIFETSSTKVGLAIRALRADRIAKEALAACEPKSA